METETNSAASQSVKIHVALLLDKVLMMNQDKITVMVVLGATEVRMEATMGLEEEATGIRSETDMEIKKVWLYKQALLCEFLKLGNFARILTIPSFFCMFYF